MSRYEKCPLCSKSFHVSLLQNHAALCCGNVTPKRKREMKETTTCPVCFKEISNSIIQSHAWQCTSSPPSSLKTPSSLPSSMTKRKTEKNASLPSSTKKRKTEKNAFTALMGKKMKIAPVDVRLPGCHVFKNFLSKVEERQLVREIDTCDPKWHVSSWNGKCESKTWGLEVDVVKRVVGKVRRPIPAAFDFMIEKMTSGEYLPLAGFVPNECNSNSYKTELGHWLRAHVDDRQLSGELLANVSLLSDSYMTYRHAKTGQEVRVFLPRRSLQVVSKESRYDWTHEIRKHDILNSRRVSITFRGNGQTKGSKRPPAVGKPEYLKYTL